MLGSGVESQQLMVLMLEFWRLGGVPIVPFLVAAGANDAFL